jgi:hypothetical protein
MNNIDLMLADWEKNREKHDRFMDETNRIILMASPGQIRQVQKAGIVTQEDRIAAIQNAMKIRARAAQALVGGKKDYAQVLFRRAGQEVRIADMLVTRN